MADVDPGLRDQLAEWVAMFDSKRARMIADYLAPKVSAHFEQQARARAADVLDAAADACDRIGVHAQATVFRARAAALRGQA